MRSAWVQRALTRNPDGTRSGLDMANDIQPGDPVNVGDFLLDPQQWRWYTYRGPLGANQLIVSPENNQATKFIYNMQTQTYQSWANHEDQVGQGMVDQMAAINQGGSSGKKTQSRAR